MPNCKNCGEEFYPPLRKRWGIGKQEFCSRKCANKYNGRLESTKIRTSLAYRGKGNGFYSKKHSEETKRKMSEAKKGKSLSKSHKDSISAGLMRHYIKEGILEACPDYRFRIKCYHPWEKWKMIADKIHRRRVKEDLNT